MPSRLYGKAKIHKTGCSLRPVTSMINSFEHNLPKWLDSLIKTYIPDSDFLSSNSTFISKIKEFKFINDVRLVSFDVTSLLTNVPVDLAKDDISSKLFSSNVAPELLFLHPKNKLRKISLKNSKT